MVPTLEKDIVGVKDIDRLLLFLPRFFYLYVIIIQAGVIGLTKTVAREYAGRSITCNAIAPGYIESDMTKAIDPKYTEGILKQIPLGETSILNQTGTLASAYSS